MQSTGLRERKKVETYRRLATAARELAMAKGLEAVTVEDIAAAADVSPRTFFNYFANKEDAIVGVDPSALDDVRVQLIDRPPKESPLQALRAVLAPSSEELAEVAYRWTMRTQLVCRYPSLTPRHLAGLAKVETALSSALAERLGTDDDDPYPTLVVAAVVGALRATLTWWEANGHPLDLDSAVDRVFTTLAALDKDDR